ncbi:LOW QUALITY PROTEIN: putative uncharacterized protein DDB_G0277255 [Panonychus citri]|uniref:LOW QUALITY PROTEIN: putative uncharacterized protein DDB_G0277255 n=1 Tax=Panonychus citri TaxID=50023 RepID=UPI00230743B8|nr:LOW QUALITY PROTEIN: putative uncharacterized protein DDB_G0277255 [Panonychus citri]
MDVKLSSTSSPSLPKQFDFCDDLSEHGYGSLEDLDCPTSIGSPMVQGCDGSSSSLPKTITTTTLTSSSSSSPPLSSSSSIDSIASLNSSNSPKSTEPSQPESISNGKHCNSSHENNKKTGDQDSDKNLINSPVDNSINTNSLKESNHGYQEISSGELKNDEKNNDGKVHSPSPQMAQSGNRFRFVPKNRQTNDTKSKGSGTCQAINRNGNYRGPRKHSRSESDCVNREHENRKRSQMRNKNNDNIIFVIKRVDRSLRRTVSESSGGETLPVRGILKYPRDWNRRTLSESNCDNSDQSNLMDSHENGQTQSLECISPLEASCEASTESACSSAGESPIHDEEKPKKSVHFNCFVSKATFNINSIILNNNSHAGSHKKKNRRQNNNQSSNYHNNDHSNTSITTTTTTNNNNKILIKTRKTIKITKTVIPTISKIRPLDVNHNNLINKKTTPLNQAIIKHKLIPPNHQMINNQPILIQKLSSLLMVTKCQNENIDPTEAKMRSRQDSGYDSETNERKGFLNESETTTTCVKSPNRQFTVKKVDLN